MDILYERVFYPNAIRVYDEILLQLRKKASIKKEGWPINKCIRKNFRVYLKGLRIRIISAFL